MTDNPLISIIMNCYNGEKYLQEALDSVINQTYKNKVLNWEPKVGFQTGIENVIEWYQNQDE